MHSFRHALRDQLRAVNCPNEVSKAIGGWSEGNDVSSYKALIPVPHVPNLSLPNGVVQQELLYKALKLLTLFTRVAK